ncbi:MAG: glycosyltransferase [Flavobacteriales bacterium]|nr:glycosyltransferase [Flavobacteriales bacterium]
MKVIFLYTELAGYIRACFERLAQSGAEVHVVAYPINREAPFRFGEKSEAIYYDRSEMTAVSLNELINEVYPNALFCSGWIDKGYIESVTKAPLTINKVLISDNAFSGRLREYVSLLRAKTKYKKVFDYAFVSGEPQKKYALKMGFEKHQVFTGFYTADEEIFRQLKTKNENADFPKRFVYVGRYIDFKGVRNLWDMVSFMAARGWELHCAGVGDLWDERPIQEGVFHYGFLQSSGLLKLMAEGGVFILPSHKEPWGVVVHEFAAAGFPLLLSNRVNSSSAFLVEEKNGFSFRANKNSALEKSLDKIMNLSSAELNEMAMFSRELSRVFSVSKWLKTVEVIANRKK